MLKVHAMRRLLTLLAVSILSAGASARAQDYPQKPVRAITALSGIPTRGLAAPLDTLFFSDLDYDFEQLAVFGELSYALNDRLELM